MTSQQQKEIMRQSYEDPSVGRGALETATQDSGQLRAMRDQGLVGHNESSATEHLRERGIGSHGGDYHYQQKQHLADQHHHTPQHVTGTIHDQHLADHLHDMNQPHSEHNPRTYTSNIGHQAQDTVNKASGKTQGFLHSVTDTVGGAVDTLLGRHSHGHGAGGGDGPKGGAELAEKTLHDIKVRDEDDYSVID